MILWEESSVENVEVWWGHQENEPRLYVYYLTVSVRQNPDVA